MTSIDYLQLLLKAQFLEQCKGKAYAALTVKEQLCKHADHKERGMKIKAKKLSFKKL